MKIKINGIEKEISRSESLLEVIENFCKQTRNVIAEVNGDIIKGADWTKKRINDGDVIELVNLVGGG